MQEFTKNTLSSTYKDDYDKANGYGQILFNNARPVQARELTQLQTILNNEIARFGRNIFKEGAAVNPGGALVNNNYEYVKLADSPILTDDIIGTEFTGSTSGVKVVILEIVNAEGSDPSTLYVNYTDTSAGTAGATPIRLLGNEVISDGGGLTYTVDLTENTPVGLGTRVSIHEGDFFTQGHFVYAAEQSKIISKYTRTPTVNIGFKVTQDIVTASDDDALFDNQGAVPNRTAPGADRHRILLNIITQDEIAADDTFVHVGNVVDGELRSVVTGNDNYNIINDLLALRTNEESGDYIVKPFKLNFETNDSDSSMINFNISPGTAYVKGYRAAIPIEVSLPISKPQTTETLNNQVVAATYGNYLLAEISGDGLPDVGNFEIVDLKSANDGTGTTIGTARVRSIEEDGPIYKLYLYDLSINSGQNKRNIQSISFVGGYIPITLTNSKAVFNDITNDSLLFNLPKTRPQSISDVSFTAQRKTEVALDGSGQGSLSPLTATGELFADTSAWIAAGGDIYAPTIVSGGAGSTAATIGGGPVSTTVDVIYYVNKAQASIRTKTLTDRTETITPDSDGHLNLDKADIFEVTRLTNNDSDGTSVSGSYDLDNGQRDNIYKLGKMTKRGGETSPTGDVFVRYKYFQHGSSGDFFGVNSYSGQVDYSNIPSHTLVDGTIVPLRDVLDFRSVEGGIVNELPRNTDLIQADVSYYLPKNAKVVVDTDGAIRVVEGDASFDPHMPESPTNALDLFRVQLNPFMISDTDAIVKPVESKRYTMADIGKLEERVDKLTELTSLSFLELETSTLDVLDSAGVNRTKSGLFVDNFADQFRSGTNLREYRAAIDPKNKTVQPSFDEHNIRLIFDESSSTNVVKKGDNVYLTYTDTSYIDQPLATESMNVNPFSVIVNSGMMDLSPSSDEWKEVRFTPSRVTDGGVRINTDQALLWNQWRWNWVGTEQEITVGTVLGSSTTAVSNTVDRVVSDETIVELFDDRIVETALIPFMRSKKIHFRATGLKPSTRMFPFFNNQLVDNWCRSEAFVQFSDTTVDYGNEHQNAIEHPEGKSNLVTTNEGILEGSFFIPATDAIKFRTGERQFKLLDISVPNNVESTSIATAEYVSRGVMETRQQSFSSTRVITVEGTSAARTRLTTLRNNLNIGGGRGGDRGGDPLAQSFFIEQETGLFITGVNLRFATKDATAPVTVQLRPMVNGSPSAYAIVPGSNKTLSPADVNVSTDATAVTLFAFDEPIFLDGITEYAIVVISNSIGYNTYVAETGAFLLGSTERRVTRQPTLGSLFKSQNSFTWEPDQIRDLTFELIRAEFSSEPGRIILHNSNTPKEQLIDNPFTTTLGSQNIDVFEPNHGFTVGDMVTITGAPDINGILAVNLNISTAVTAIDGDNFRFVSNGSGLNATSSGIGGGSTITTSRNMTYDIAVPYFETLRPTFTTVNYRGRFTTGMSIAGDETAYIKDVNYATIFPRQNNIFNAPRLVASLENETLNLGAGVKSTDIAIDLNSGSTNVSPVLDLQRASMTMINNRIDNPAAVVGSGQNVPFTFIDETDPTNGSSIAKHVTVPVTLAETAVGLKIAIAANRPSTANFDVYYRTNGTTDNLAEANWIKDEPENSIPADDNVSVFREYQYLIGGQAGGLEAFDQFQVKIVFRSSNSSKVPVLKDLRIIALSV